jgi:hypothetical protein
MKRAEKIFFMSLSFQAISALFLCSQPAICQERSVPDPLDEGHHLTQETPFGPITLGVRGSTLSPDRKEGAADLELGYVFVRKADALMPYLVEIKPFFIDRLEQRDDILNTKAGYGAGVKISTKKVTSNSRWFVRFAAVNLYDQLEDSSETSETSIEVSFGLELSLDPTRRQSDALDRLRSTQTFIHTSVPSWVYEHPEQFSPEQVRYIHSLLMGAYFGQVKGAELLKVPDNDIYEITVAEDLVSFFQSDLFKRKIRPEEENLLTDRVSSTLERKREILSTYLKPWLIEKLSGDYPFMFHTTGGSSEIRWELDQDGIRVANGQAVLFNRDQMIDDFIDNLASSLSYHLDDLRKIQFYPTEISH